MTVQFIYAQLDCIAHLELLKLLFKSEYTHLKHENSAISSFRLRFVNLSKPLVKTCVVKFFLAKTMICEVAQVLFIC